MSRSRIYMMLATLMVALALVLGGCDGDNNAGVGGNEGVIENTEGVIEGEEGVIEGEEEAGD